MSDEAAYDPRSIELGFKLYPQRLRSPEVKRFVGIARRLRSVYETAESVSEIEFLRDLDGLLPELYAAAAKLPERVWFTTEEEEELGLDTDRYSDGLQSPLSLADQIGRWKDWFDKMGRILGWHRIIHIVFDPVNGNEPDSIPADLADDLASIYVDITEWLALYDLDGDIEVDHAIWHWRFDWEHHWGPHLVHAMVAIQSLVHFHYDEDNRGFTNWLPKQ